MGALGSGMLRRWWRRPEVGVWLSTGEEFYARIDPAVLAELEKAQPDGLGESPQISA